MDRFSRHVLSSRLSNSVGVEFCVDALEDAPGQATAEIMNTDQAARFTSRYFTKLLSKHGLAISIDGRDRAIDNVMIEVLWRTDKDREICFNEYDGGTVLHQEVGATSPTTNISESIDQSTAAVFRSDRSKRVESFYLNRTASVALEPASTSLHPDQ